jgi:hypothetical protein
VFRPARRVSWGTRIFAGLVFILAVGAVAAFVILVLPSQIATLSQSEARELRTGRQATADVSASVATLWGDVASKGSLSLPDDRLNRDLALSQATEKAAEDALGHVQAAESYLAQIDGIPFQLHPAAISASDRPALLHLEKSLGAAIKLAHGATLQLTIAQHVNQDAQTLAGPLSQSLAAHDWTAASRTAASIQQDLKFQETPAADPEALLDPLWTTWMDAMIGYASSAQQFSLTSAAGQTQSAQQLARAMAAANDRTGAAMAAAQAGAPAWQQKTVQPVVDTLRKELAAGS